MAKQAAKKPEVKKAPNGERRNRKAFKQHPKTNEQFKSGHTIKGRSPETIAYREKRLASNA